MVTYTDEQKKTVIDCAVERLKDLFPDALCALKWGGNEQDAWKLMVMGRLSAQCTDARVNIVCEELFEKYGTPEALAGADIEDVEKIIRPCGLYHVKAADIIGECRMLTENYGGKIPDTMEELLKFPGVGRKIANLLLGDIFGKPGVVTDTHCIRICGRLGMYPEQLKDPGKVEKILSDLIEPQEQSDFCHRIVMFGREVCTARSPKCSECCLSDICAGKRDGHSGDIDEI